MATNITLAQFNKIATGDYNAGQIDFRTKDSGHLYLQKYNWLDRLDAEKAVTSLTRFADMVKLWKGLVAETMDRTPADDDDLPLPGSGNFMPV